MSENMEKFRHLDGSGAEIRRDHIQIILQHGNPKDKGVNGCRLEDVLSMLEQKLHEFQSRELACEENVEAIHHLRLAREALELRHKRRVEQGLLGGRTPHQSAKPETAGSSKP